MIDQCNTGLRLLTKTITTHPMLLANHVKVVERSECCAFNSWVRTVEHLPQAQYDKDAIVI